MTYSRSSQPGPAGQKVPATLHTAGEQQIQSWSPGDIQFRTKRLNPSHEVAAADKTHPYFDRVFGSRRCSRRCFRFASSNPRRRRPQLQELQRREELFINGLRLPTSTVAFLAVADSPDDSSAVLAAIHVVAIHELQRCVHK
jgi:hypothetical protein